MSGKNPFDDMLEMGKAWMKSTGVDADSFMPKGLEGLLPTMPKEAIEGFLGKGISPDGLDGKTRLLMTVAGLVASGAESEMPIKLAVRHALEAGASKQEIIETIAQMAMFGGVSSMTSAMKIAQAVMDEHEEDET